MILPAYSLCPESLLFVLATESKALIVVATSTTTILLCFPEFDLKNEQEIKDIEVPPPTKRHKIRMNRLFRERVGGTFLPFPEADNFYERVRSKLVIKLKIHEFLDRRKERKREMKS